MDARELEGRRRAVHEGRPDEPVREVRQGRGVRGGSGLEERAQRRRPRAERAGRQRPQEVRRGREAQEARAADDPRVSAEDDRGLRHVHQVRPRRAGAGDDQVPQGAHLLRVQPLRRVREAVRGHRAEVPEARAVALLGQPAARLLERPGQDQGGRELGRQVPRDARAHEGPRVRQADDLAEERHVRHGRPRVREGEELQGVWPLHAGCRRGAAGSPEARRAVVERRAVLPERAPGRPGSEGASGSHPGAPEGSAGAKGAVPRGGRLPPAGLLLEGRRALRGLREQVPG